MSIEARREGERLLVAHIRGTLHSADLAGAQRTAAKVIGEVGKVSLLVLLEDFRGWAPGEEWGDVSFLLEHDRDIEKMAIVGREEWREKMLVFAGVGIRKSPVRYFNDSASARAWLAENPATS
jgi:hypothetical protein